VILYFFSALFFMLSHWLNRKNDRVILDTLSICLYLLGYGLFAMGFDISRAAPIICHLLFVLIAIITLIINRSYILTFVSVLIITGSLIAIIFDLEIPNLIHVLMIMITFLTIYFMLNEAKFLKIRFTEAKRHQAIRTGLTFSYLLCLYFLGSSLLSDKNWSINYVSSAILILLLMW